jgi:sulfur carrier protein ThiS
MNIYLNGELREVPENLTLAVLLDWLKLPSGSRRGGAQPRDRRKIHLDGSPAIQPDDRLEVVHFVGGGAEDLVIGSSGH